MSVAARELATVFLEMFDTDCKDQLNPESEREFWRFVRDHALSKVPIAKKVEKKLQPFNKARAKSFEEQIVPFGKHLGQKVGWVWEHDQEYLWWLTLHEEDFVVELKRYLAYMKDEKK